MLRDESQLTKSYEKNLLNMSLYYAVLIQTKKRRDVCKASRRKLIQV